MLVWTCSDEDLPYSAEETSHLESLRSADFDVTVAPRSLDWDKLAAFANVTEPSIFHFIGHGTRDGDLVIRDGANHVRRPATDVVRLVREASPALEGVYLSGCFTAKTAPELLESLPPAAGWAIGTTAEVDDELATRFAERFYEHLIGSEMRPRQAFEVARVYAESDWGEEVSHTAWFRRSDLPAVEEMAKTISSALRTIFNRSAFLEPMRQELSMQALDDALLDVSHTLGTGQALSRRYQTPIPAASIPVEWLHDPAIQSFVREAKRGITAARRALRELSEAAAGEDHVVGNGFQLDPHAQIQWMRKVNAVDLARNKVLRTANKLLTRNGVPPLQVISVSFARNEMPHVS
ncbi:CHAT domain-containing protein [Microbacterium galbinum]|nr:CHAT domain-containing protein [Microbacterium galbinum]